MTLSQAVPDPARRGAAFGFLHALDVGGAAGVYVIIALAVHLAFGWIFLGGIVPLAASTIVLSQARTGAN